MKGDFSRYTFDKEKHYNGVLMQQGRVQLDADWNEQQAINRYRTQTEAGDVIGPCGAPLDNPGFEITFPAGKKLKIGKGRHYSDGILSENEKPVIYEKQPDFPEPPDITKLLADGKATVGLVYLDTWQRNITALDDHYIREKALGGPDTTTRIKTIWQVKVLPLPSVKIDDPDKLAKEIVKQQELDEKLLELLPEGDPQDIEDIRSKLALVQQKIMNLAPPLLCGKQFAEWKKQTAPSTGKLKAHTVQPPQKTGPCLVPPLAGYQRLENQLYRVEVHIGGTRNEATFKWSRNNASVVTEIKKIDGKEVTVSDVGKDEVLGFANGQWVEVSDDKRELNGRPGQLVQIADVNSATNTIRLKTAPAGVDMAMNPKLRRWDQTKQPGLPATANGVKMKAGWLPLEGGIEVQFSNDNYKIGDYWLIPARTATGEIEWPPYKIPNTNPSAKPPLGIEHHFCRMAMFFFNKKDKKLYRLEDCRKLFPSLTELTSLFYVSGDGQEAKAGKDLPRPLQVGVANGKWPVAGATVRFDIPQDGGNGQLHGTGPEGHVLTGPDGIASCRWTLDDTNHSQKVEATLLGSGGKPMHLPIRFTANLHTEAGRGCAVTIGADGQFKTLNDAFNALVESQDICLCLMPGSHVIEEDIDVRGKNSVKIEGCSASIEQKAEQFYLEANKILLLDYNLNVTTSSGAVTLSGDEVTVERSTFMRTAEAPGPPLVTVARRETTTDLRWRSNRMTAWWRKRANAKAADYLLPDATVSISPAVRKRMDKLVKTDPYMDENAYNKTLELVAKDMKRLGNESRALWNHRRPTRKINDLPGKSRKAVTEFYNLLANPEVNPAALAESISTAIRVFIEFGYSDALALEHGVGGCVEDNNIAGYLALHYYSKFTALAWQKATDETLANRRRFLKLGREYIVVDPVALTLRGNNLYEVRSNAYSIMQVMNTIMTTGDWGDHNMPETGYEFLTVTGNIFSANGSSFVAQSITITDNIFAGKVNQALGVAAFVLGYAGILVGNNGASQSLDIETMIRPDWVRESANLVSIAQ